MMEREINLLPPQVALVRSSRVYLKQGGRLLRFVIFLTVLLLAVMGSARVVVWHTQQTLMTDTPPDDAQQTALVSHVRRLNAQLTEIKARQASAAGWTAQLPEILQAMPAGIGLTYVGAREETQTLELRGTVARREALVTWQRQLEALPWVAQVESPLSNFATGQDAQFSLVVARKKQP